MLNMKIGIDNNALGELQYILAQIGTQPGVLRRTAGAMEAGAKHIQDTWQNYAAGAMTLPGVAPLKNGSRRYVNSIRAEQTGPFAHEIFSEADIADWIENGTKELDMKTTHPFGPRSRVSKKGIPYLIVPFQWGTKEGTIRSGPRNIVPKSLLSLMRSKRFKQSTVKDGKKLSPNSRGQMVERFTYSWGDRAGGSDFAGTVEQKSYADGMVRFEQSEEKGRRYGGYFTFRVISAKSPKNSWIKPATPARHVTRGVQEYTEDTITAMVEAAIMEDVKV